MAEETRKGYLRLNHFHGLRLESEDFETGERYPVEKRKLHNRLMHGAGVVRRWQGELKVSGRRKLNLRQSLGGTRVIVRVDVTYLI